MMLLAVFLEFFKTNEVRCFYFVKFVSRRIKLFDYWILSWKQENYLIRNFILRSNLERKMNNRTVNGNF